MSKGRPLHRHWLYMVQLYTTHATTTRVRDHQPTRCAHAHQSKARARVLDTHVPRATIQYILEIGDVLLSFGARRTLRPCLLQTNTNRTHFTPLLNSKQINTNMIKISDIISFVTPALITPFNCIKKHSLKIYVISLFTCTTLYIHVYGIQLQFRYLMEIKIFSHLNLLVLVHPLRS